MKAPEGRVVVVTGGSRGLGAAIVQQFLDAGDRVATFSRGMSTTIERWRSNATINDRFHFKTVDLTDTADSNAFVRDVIERWRKIDVLVNNAGIAHEAVLGLATDEDIDAMIDVNLKSTVHITRAVVRRMLTQGSGRVINISSIVGLSG